ncbi:MAG: alanine racemase, partial [Clostridia bacterium]|nr:alanine racemase [Clostridia bacterium]
MVSGPASPRATARIDLGRLTDNYRALLARLRQDSPCAALWCVVKAGAYGHGAEAVTRALFGAGARRFCAA